MRKQYEKPNPDDGPTYKERIIQNYLLGKIDDFELYFAINKVRPFTLTSNELHKAIKPHISAYNIKRLQSTSKQTKRTS